MVKKLFLCCVLLLSPFLQAQLNDHWIFYQPQTRDMDVSAQQWADLFAAVKAQGAAGIVLQWSQYGDQDFHQDDAFWLGSLFDLAAQAELNVIVGLSLDDAFFERIKQPSESLQFYLKKQAAQADRVAEKWRPYVDSPAFYGWYISEEVDDYHWRSPAKKTLLLDYLTAVQRSALLRAENKPVYISAYLGGFQSSQSTQALLSAITLNGKVKVWLQDGMGTQALSPSKRAYYYQPHATCEGDITVSGWVYEYFRQDKTGDTVSFLPPTASQWQAQQTEMAAYCREMTLIFSLRYLPVSKGTLIFKE